MSTGYKRLLVHFGITSLMLGITSISFLMVLGWWIHMVGSGTYNSEFAGAEVIILLWGYLVFELKKEYNNSIVKLMKMFEDKK